MKFLKALVAIITLGSDHPMRRLAAYYAILALVVVGLLQVPYLAELMFPVGGADALRQGSRLLTDGLAQAPVAAPAVAAVSPVDFALGTLLAFLATLALMLPVTWVYMSDHRKRVYDQAMVETLLVLPIVVAGTVLVVRNSLALAFSLAGVVAAVRFRTSLSDSRDVVFIFLAIAIGFAAGVQVLTVAAVLSILFNLLLVISWRYGFGRNVLVPTATQHWRAPLDDLATTNGDGTMIPDRELVLALTPQKSDVLARKFKRVQVILGKDDKKPRFNAVLTITTNLVAEAQKSIEGVLDDLTKRWKLDEVVPHDGKPSELFYLVRARKTTTGNDLLTAIRAGANGSIETADVEVGDAITVEEGQMRSARKKRELEV